MTNGFVCEVVLLIDSIDILVFQFSVFYCKNISDFHLWVETVLLQSDFSIG